MGDLGAGKTKFTQGILEYFGLDKEISSPTFTIVNEYRNDSILIYHFDVYRLTNEEAFLDIGGDEYFGNGLCIIEWGEIIKNLLPPNTIFINFKKDNSQENLRIITIN
ncbi:MAG: tRNA (adenosine(37)-N6)-threonylcarbamoyltransferase complex ATPase subunit type 1 TsaE [Clostridia bacterium]|nr:tRNA (adenosine(37)-N6)-threonylcarbamoyltransferase complex ATPase subunit type 1 TsaE [Clostridia bacterium]